MAGLGEGILFVTKRQYLAFRPEGIPLECLKKLLSPGVLLTLHSIDDVH